MTNYSKMLNLLGIAKRAGKIVSGEPTVLADIRKGKMKFLFIASDCGKASLKKFTDKCNFYKVPYTTMINKADLSDAIGQSRTIVGITDKGFAEKLNELNE